MPLVRRIQPAVVLALAFGMLTLIASATSCGDGGDPNAANLALSSRLTKPPAAARAGSAHLREPNSKTIHAHAGNPH